MIEIWESSEYEPLNSLRVFSTKLRPHGHVLVGKGDQRVVRTGRQDPGPGGEPAVSASGPL